MFNNSKWFSSLWALLFAFCLILLWWKRKQWQTGYKALFWTIILAVMIIYCPLLASFLIPRFLPGYPEYERLAWVFFEIPLISFVLIKLAQELKTKKDKTLFGIVIVIILILIGSPDNREYYRKPENVYKMSGDALTICTMIENDTDKPSPLLSIQLKSPKSVRAGSSTDGRMYYGIRHYDSSFIVKPRYISVEDYNKSGFSYNNKTLPVDTDYFIAPKNDHVYKALERKNYVCIGESENFGVFRNESKKDKE